MWNISQHKISCPWPPTAPTGWQIHNTLAEPTTVTDIPAALSLLTHCRLNGLTAKFSSMYWETIQVLRVIQFVPGTFEHTGTMGTPFLALLPMYQGLTRGLLWTWYPGYGTKTLGETQTPLHLIKIHLDIFVLCTLRMSEHSGHYCIVMYKYDINVFMIILIYIQALPWHADIPLKFQMTSLCNWL